MVHIFGIPHLGEELAKFFSLTGRPEVRKALINGALLAVEQTRHIKTQAEPLGLTGAFPFAQAGAIFSGGIIPFVKERAVVDGGIATNWY